MNKETVNSRKIALSIIAACGFISGAAVAHGSGDAARHLLHEEAEVVVSEERFPATWFGRTAVITAPGEIDLTSAQSLRNALLSALNAGALGLVVDMTTTTFIDSAGVTALVRASRRATATEAAVRLAVTAPPVLRVLSLVGVDQLIEVHPSVTAAVASLPRRRAEPLRLPGHCGDAASVTPAQARLTRSGNLHRQQYAHPVRA